MEILVAFFWKWQSMNLAGFLSFFTNFPQQYQNFFTRKLNLWVCLLNKDILQKGANS